MPFLRLIRHTQGQIPRTPALLLDTLDPQQSRPPSDEDSRSVSDQEKPIHDDKELAPEFRATPRRP